MASSCRSNVTRVAFRNVVVSERGCILYSLSSSLVIFVSLSLFLARSSWSCRCRCCAFVPRARAWRVARANGKVNHAFYYRLRGIPENSLEKPKPSVDSLSLFFSRSFSLFSSLLSRLSLQQTWGTTRWAWHIFVSVPFKLAVSIFSISRAASCSVDSATCWTTARGRPRNGVNRLVRFERADCKSPDLFGIVA